MRACASEKAGSPDLFFFCLPCAHNHLTQADASLKHSHSRWPAEKPDESLSVSHISIVLLCFVFFRWGGIFDFLFCFVFLLPHLSEIIPKFHKNRPGHPGWVEGPTWRLRGGVISSSDFLISPTFFQRSRVTFNKRLRFGAVAAGKRPIAGCVCLHASV